MINKINQKLEYYYYYLFLTTGLLFQFMYTKTEGYLILTHFRTEFLTSVFKVVTWMGDGITAAVIAILSGFIRIRTAIFLLLGYVVSGILVQVIKRFIFPDSLRPVAYFREIGKDIPVPENVQIYLNHSFPSGHTATVFALLFGIALLTRNKILKLLLISLAMITGYSRIYLALHFPSDVIAGSVIGVLTASLLYSWIVNWEKDWLDKPLTKLLRNSI